MANSLEDRVDTLSLLQRPPPDHRHDRLLYRPTADKVKTTPTTKPVTNIVEVV
jgi:hypothetical protein